MTFAYQQLMSALRFNDSGSSTANSSISITS
jgi:hypothetical protein